MAQKTEKEKKDKELKELRTGKNVEVLSNDKKSSSRKLIRTHAGNPAVYNIWNIGDNNVVKSDSGVDTTRK